MQGLLDSFCEIVGISSAIIDLDGIVVVESNWQRLCTSFHRVNPETCKRCVESDTQLANQLKSQNRQAFYRCKNGLTDAAAPIILAGEHVANFFVGQFFLEEPDLAFFKDQAKIFAFDEEEYLRAVGEVPVIPKEKLTPILNYLSHFAQTLAEIGLKEVRRKESEAAFRASSQEKEKTEEKLKHQQDFIKKALDAQNDTFFVFDPKTGKALHWNQAFAKVSGYNDDEISRLPAPASYYSSEDLEKAKACVEKVIAKGQGSTVIDFICKDGSRVPFEYSASILKGDEDSPDLVISIGRDITDRKKAEEERLKLEAQLRQDQRLESLGVLAGGIAHDFNNILTAILGNISIAQLRLEPGNPILEHLNVADQATTQAKNLTQQLLTFSKGGAPILKTSSIADILTEASGFVLHGSNVKCAHAIPEDLWPVDIDAGQINQVFQNLIINANQAMPQGGEINVVASNVTLPPNNSLDLPEGKYVKIAVTDQGCGMPPSRIEKIFDPFFSTKSQGSGLGLSTSHSIINRHNGTITVDSEVDKGSTFQVYLPASEHTPQSDPEMSDVVCLGNGKVLVMDDDPTLRLLLVKMLEKAGYDVACAQNGQEAIQLYRDAMNENAPFDAVILDLTIPGNLGGIETLEKLREIAPDVKAIVSSGYADDPALANFKDYGFAGAVSKPYTIQSFSRILHDALAE